MERVRESILVRRAAAGDRSAAAELIRAYQGGLYTFLLRMCKHHETAEDITQEAFVRVLSSLDRYDSTYRFSTWLYVIARRQMIARLEKRAPTVANTAADVAMETGEARRDVWMDAGRQEQRALLEKAMEALSPSMRETLVLFHQHEWTVDRIAEVLDVPEGTVKSTLHRARNRLRAVLMPWWNGKTIVEKRCTQADMGKGVVRVVHSQRAAQRAGGAV